MRDPLAIARVFLAALPDGVARPDAAQVPPSLAAAYDAGAAAFPDVPLDPDVLARHLASLATTRALLPRPDLAADVYLACACALGHPRAVEAFERAHAPSIARAVARVVPSL